jgi:UDP-N-acetylglucosamine 2-epimerase (non-hydrolysing)
MAPLIKRFQKKDSQFQSVVAVTGQHREMLDQVLSFFQIKPDFDLDLMSSGQSLAQLTGKLADALDKLFTEVKPDVLFVQGDTTTAMMGGLIGYYHQLKVVHIEAGLRSQDIFSPFPEEVNRKIVGNVAFAHMVPTIGAQTNLEREGYSNNIFITGNTVVDALFLGLNMINENPESIDKSKYGSLNLEQPFILVTGHRRESFGASFDDICHAILSIKNQFPNFQFVYPVHLNPMVKEPVNRILGSLDGIHLIDPLDYPHLIFLMQTCYLILTDSGGIQEEAPSLGKPVLVMRDVTERMEGVVAGTAKLVGTNKSLIINEVVQLITDKSKYEKMSKATNPYGDGNASNKIYNALIELM